MKKKNKNHKKGIRRDTTQHKHIVQIKQKYKIDNHVDQRKEIKQSEATDSIEQED